MTPYLSFLSFFFLSCFCPLCSLSEEGEVLGRVVLLFI